MGSTDSVSFMRIDQANVFYNYTIGFESSQIDLVKTARNVLKAGVARAILFSDLKCLYTDSRGNIQFEWIRPKGRQWDPSWKVEFDKETPAAVAAELLHALEISFHEKRIEGRESRQSAPYLRASLPPIILKDDSSTLPLFTEVKIFSDGIAILSFQLDTTWDGVDETYFISNIVNLYQRYFGSIWIDSRIQKLDGEHLIPTAFQDEIFIAGNPVTGLKVKFLIKKMRKRSRQLLDDALDAPGQYFDINDEEWLLHEIAASGNDDSWESTIELCRSEYANALSELVVFGHSRWKSVVRPAFIWQGRPSVSLMRFREQPSTKTALLSNFAPSLSRFLMRAIDVDMSSDFPPDLRPMSDFCFHGNRALLLWTWVRADGSATNAWDDKDTRSLIMASQARAEHIEYHNMRVARACSWAKFPPSDIHLLEAYETLSFAEDVIHNSSQSGEITDALAYLMAKFGTLKLVLSGKDSARWHLEELRYRAERRRNATDRWLAFVFGLVGTTGIADFIINPYLTTAYPELEKNLLPIYSFGMAGFIVLLIAFVVWLLNKFRQ